MDPLSALKSIIPPGMTGPLTGAGAGSAVPKSIPLAELQQLAQPGAAATTGPAATPGFPAEIGPAIAPVDGTAAGANGFSAMLQNFVGDVVQKQADASTAMNGLLSGKNVSLHQAMISMEEANISFQLMLEVRNKLLDSYQELMRMQI